MIRSFFKRGRLKGKLRAAQETNKFSNTNFSLKISKTVYVNIENLQNMLDHPDNLKIRELELGKAKIKCAIAYIDGLVDEQSIQQNILGSLQQQKDSDYPNNANSILDFIYWNLIAGNSV